MSIDVPLRCRCGKVFGVARDVSPTKGNRVVCYCRDCQAFARFLDRPDREVGHLGDVLDPLGGSDIYQTAAARVSITEGASHLRAMRLSPRGLIRWYTGCCKTPVANTVSGRVPFAGLVQPFMDHAGPGRDEVLGPPAYVHGKGAIGGQPAHAPATVTPRFAFRAARRLLRWLVTGMATPSPFFDPKTKAPIVAPEVLTPDQRRALTA